MSTSADARLANRILLGLGVGIVAGALVVAVGQFLPALLGQARWLATTVLDPLGQVFLRVLFFVVIPLVFGSLAAGVVQIGRLERLGPLAAATFTLFLLNMAIAVVLGLAMMHVLDPGAALDPETREALLAQFNDDSARSAGARAATPAVSFPVIVDMLLPRNLLGAVVGRERMRLGEMLPLIVFALLIGVVAAGFPTEKRARVQDALDLVCELMTGIVRLALQIAPIAVPALIFSVIVKIGFDILFALGVFVLGCAAVLLLQLFGTMTVWLRLWTDHAPLDFFRRIRTVLVTAFTTSSSNATLPTSLAVARTELGIAPSTAGFVLPLGATMNMAGTALYEGAVVLFLGQVFGVELSLAAQATLVVLAVLSAIAVAGIPGGSLPLIAGLLVTFGIPAEGIAIILGVDRLLDMLRTTVNVGADLVTAAVIDARVHRQGSAPLPP
jgi:DAACS family dicarboxylate/amino acid:cation (Na+ or H+) symporter